MDRTPSRLHTLFSELRRRHVFRVAAAYGVVAWLLIQVAATTFPAFGAPAWVLRVVIALAALGFPLALVLAWAFELTPEGVRRAEPLRGGTGGGGEQPRPALRQIRRSVAFVLGVLVALSGGWYAAEWREGGTESGGLDANAVAVLPFRVAGADPALAYLREGMLDLLAAKLTGEGGPRAVDPRTLMSAWLRATEPRAGEDLAVESSLALARGLGAGQILHGGIVGTPSHLVMSASLVDVASGAVRAQASAEGPQDSLVVMADRLAAALLSLNAGEDERSLPFLTSTSLPALRAFLEGRSAYRSGRYAEAKREFGRALEHDSAFALAHLGLADAVSFSPSQSGGGESLRRAWAHRDRLSESERLVLAGRLGPNYPEPSSGAELLAARMRALGAHPDRPEVWYYAGDQIYHWGALIGRENWREQAAGYFRRAVELDSTYTPALMHLIQLEGTFGDTAAVRRLSASYLSNNSSGETAEHLRWYSALILGDGAALDRVRHSFDDLSSFALFYIAVAYGVWEGLALEDAERAMTLVRGQAGTLDERRIWHSEGFAFDLNRGRPDAAAAAAEGLRELEPRLVPRLHVLAALYSVGDTARAAAAARELSASTEPPAGGGEPEVARAEGFADLCVLEQWRLARGETQTAAASAARLRAPAGATAGERARNETCAQLLEAQLAIAEGRSDAPRLLARLDSLLRTDPLMWGPPDYANAAVARLHLAQGDADAALAAIRRRTYGIPRVLFFADHLREEGRLAALAGDTALAIRAYSHYLALRSDPEPSVRPEVERVRVELARLTRRGK